MPHDNATLVPETTRGATRTGPTLGNATVLPDMDDAAGTLVTPLPQTQARYDVMEELGRGGMGQVVAATDRDIGRRVAIKRILGEYARNPNVMLRFVREVRTAGQLDHPNIVTIHDVGRQPDGELYFVMKLLDGVTLEDVLARLRAGDPRAHAEWTFARRVEAFVQILHAMRLAHERGIVHRDLKPSNVMVGAHGEVTIVDWGLAKNVGAAEIAAGPQDAPTSGRSTMAGSLIGTPRYMSPEQARGEPADARSDTWQLSMMLYELLTLHHPFEGIDDVEPLLEAVRTARIPHPRELSHPAQSGVPADLGWYVVDGLQRDPSRRFRDAGAMLDRLHRRADGEIPVQCLVTAQKAALNKSSGFLDRHPFLATGLAVLWVGATVSAVLVGVFGLVGGLVAAVVL